MYQIDLMSRIPIYEQIIDQTQRFILMGLLRPGDKMPSVRNLSVELSVNPNTIQRAYTDMCSRGMLCAAAGKGCFVAGEALLSVRAEKEGKIKAFRQLTEELMLAGFWKEQLLRTVEEVWRSRPESGEEEKHD